VPVTEEIRQVFDAGGLRVPYPGEDDDADQPD
jgi:hypothetical protein